MPDDDNRLLADLMMRLLCAAIDQDLEEVSRLLGEIGDDHGPNAMFGVCCALAEAVRQFAFPEFPRGDGSLTGDMVAFEKLPGAKTDRETEWACRFVAAYINGDSETTLALFFGSIDDAELHVGGVVALLGMAADLGRQKEAETRAQG